MMLDTRYWMLDTGWLDVGNSINSASAVCRGAIYRALIEGQGDRMLNNEYRIMNIE